MRNLLKTSNELRKMSKDSVVYNNVDDGVLLQSKVKENDFGEEIRLDSSSSSSSDNNNNNHTSNNNNSIELLNDEIKYELLFFVHGIFNF